MSWVYVAILAVSVVVSIALAPKLPAQKSPSLEDLEVPTAEEGRPIPVVFGTVTVQSPNVVWYGDITYKPVKRKAGK